MKRLLLSICTLLIMQTAMASGLKLYIWVKYPKSINYGYGLQIAVNNERLGSIKVKELAEVQLKGDKKYMIEIFDNGRSLGTAQINKTNDTIMYYQLSIAAGWGGANIQFEEQEKTKGGLYVMQTSNYTRKLNFYEDGMEDGFTDHAGFGSGFLISSDGYIVTNLHVVDKAKKITVKGIDGDFTTEYAADLITKDVNNDLVLLQLKNKNVKFTAPPYTIRTQGANTGEDIFVLGYPLKTSLGEEVKLTTGVISAKSGYEGNVSSYQISAPAQPGNSGGPLFDKDGNLIGVVNAKVMNTENITYAVKAIYLQALLGMLPTEPKLNIASALKDKNLADKVKEISKFTYIIETE